MSTDGQNANGQNANGGGADGYLATYLRDHRAGAEAGLALAARCRKANEQNRVGRALVTMEAEIVADRRALIQVMERLDVPANPIKMTIARAAEFVGRIKRNGTAWRYSPSSRVVELEGLLAGVTAKRSLWTSLLHASRTRPELEEATFQALISRATSQITRLTAEHDWAVATAFSRLAG